VLKLRSVSSLVIAPANTGRDRSSRNAVTNTAHTNRGSLCLRIPGARLLIIVTIKLIAPLIDPAPERCRLKIARSTEGPECACTLDSGGYTVQPVPAPPSTSADTSRRNREGGSSQKLILFLRGNALSGAPIRIGTRKLPKPPIRIGLTLKKILRKACAVITTL
jgi:hypothetical protein